MQATGIVDRRVDIGTAGLEQEHLRTALDEAAGGGGACRAGADDDDVGHEIVGIAVMDGVHCGVGHGISASVSVDADVVTPSSNSSRSASKYDPHASQRHCDGDHLPAPLATRSTVGASQNGQVGGGAHGS